MESLEVMLLEYPTTEIGETSEVGGLCWMSWWEPPPDPWSKDQLDISGCHHIERD